jgi:hypothetical protein
MVVLFLVVATIGVLSSAGAFVLALAMAKSLGQRGPIPQEEWEQEA